jgi:hypothetical protein
MMHRISSYFIKFIQEYRGVLKLELSNTKKDTTKSVLPLCEVWSC